MRTDEAIEQEFTYLTEIVKQNFGVSINLVELQGQVHRIIRDKVQGYFFNRYRDWPVQDLFALDALLERKMEIDSRYFRRDKQQEKQPAK